jgi:hypothetical protein
LYNFVPFRFELPERLAFLDAMGPKDLLEEAAVLNAKNRFWNTINALTILGTCFGASSLLVGIKRPLSVLACLLVGAACGCAVALVWMQVAGLLETWENIPGIDDATRPLLIEVVSFSLVGFALSIPFAIVFRFFGGSEQRKAVMGIACSGLVVGFLLPILISIALPSVAPVQFPAADWMSTLIWLALLGLMVMTMSVLGSRSRKPKPSLEPIA